MKIVKRIILIVSVCFLLVSCLILGQGYQMYHEAIEKMPLSEKVEQYRSKEDYVSLEELPNEYKNAVISVEDHRFYQHSAIDIISIGRAIVTNLKEGELVEGGSTITQQLAKNLYFTQKQEFTRKIAEIFMAFDMENHYSKDEILELYVNTSYFGDGYDGIGQASKGYYQKHPKDLNLNESTMLAGIPNAPSVYAPTKNPELAKKRQQHVIKRMIENKCLTQEQADSILNP